VVMQMENATRATYEGAKTNAAGLNCWGQEYLRAECERATLILDRQRIACQDWPQGEPREIELLQQPKWANTWLIEQFVRWLDGNGPMATNVWDNLQSVALVFAAIESSRTGQPVKVQEFLRAAMSEKR